MSQVTKQKVKAPSRRKPQRKRLSESDGDGTCVVCANALKILAVGHCNHSICFKCSLKMRLLCDEKFCPVCRKDLEKVILTRQNLNFQELDKLKLTRENRSRANYFFEDTTIIKEFNKVLEHRCPVCPDRPPDLSFESTKVHLRKEHSLFYCDLCLEHIKNFTNEYKVYNRKDLATHKRVGDADDTSHRGHPLCEFCDQRYLDDDQLFRHLRKHHYFCHICDQADINEFYGDYKNLYSHFKSDHFVCELENCVKEQFTNVFSSELDLKAHQAATHTKNKSKQQQKLDRQIDLGFQYSKRIPQAARDRSGASGSNPRVKHNAQNQRLKSGNSLAFERDEDIDRAIALSKAELENSLTLKEQPSITSGQPETETNIFTAVEDFPSLAMNPETPSTTIMAHSDKSKAASSSAPNTLLKWTKGPNLSKPGLSEEEFPSLQTNGTSAGAVPWGKMHAKSTKAKSSSSLNQSKTYPMVASDFLKTAQSTKKDKKHKKQLKTPDIEDGDDFPSLDPSNSVKVGRGQRKHFESPSSFAPEVQSNVNIISAIPPETELGRDKKQRQNNPSNIDLANDFPSLNTEKALSVPPGFEKKINNHKRGRPKSDANAASHFQSGDVPLQKAASTVVRPPPGFHPHSNQLNGSFSLVDQNFPSLPKTQQRRVELQTSNSLSKMKSNETSENTSLNFPSEPINKGITLHTNSKKKSKGFKSQNPAHDFPMLPTAPPPVRHKAFSKSLSEVRNPTPSQPEAPSKSHGVQLNLANVFDFPSL